MTEWIKYTGSDEQIAEIKNASNGYLLRSSYGTVKANTEIFTSDLNDFLVVSTHYLICNPSPLADMICQQARTGQPVYSRMRCKFTASILEDCCEWWDIFAPTTTPDWNIPNAEYSFTPLDEEINK